MTPWALPCLGLSTWFTLSLGPSLPPQGLEGLSTAHVAGREEEEGSWRRLGRMALPTKGQDEVLG